ncbi:uncharacterized protein BP01DRAFT_366789 [Aspergillus saccharolyticus JOP 1030-1]|uniref:Secreted protein n=1 Tax=Aspergillus saccharolyticus JOP 1030-1 TaxID=1450539 RepID=A0A318ZVB4_9EURO|nr:hypothetical protein BP01DRAFT_366789 [Aspergillus saccharolyticus JOP 1030-1]PYH44068.1 hypothetical protein BP01DRAFT_366789 [Aspergillus saccharolyticus JOP 1030-1]
MLLFTFLLLAYATLTAAVTCNVRGQVHNYFDCFNCPALACGYSKRTFITAGLTRDVSCLWTDGENYKGINQLIWLSDWYYVPSDKCYIWGGRLDTKHCKGINKIPKCETCNPIPGPPVPLPQPVLPPAAAAAAAAGSSGGSPGGRRDVEVEFEA